MGELILKNLNIGYGGWRVISDFNLTLAHGEMVSLLGPSGAGKTTVLKAVAGLIRPLSGEILIDGRSVNDLAPEKRDAVMVFQQPLLFPFMNVTQNIAFGLRTMALPTATRCISPLLSSEGFLLRIDSIPRTLATSLTR